MNQMDLNVILDDKVIDTNQIIENLDVVFDNPFVIFLTDVFNDFCDLEKEIPTEDVLNKNDIIKLIQEEMNRKNDNANDSEDESVLISLDNIIKSLQTYLNDFL
ncbi:hypothetical protein C1645_814063 [Glomus cerebriforme]|uniref:Uncharacterized protein n=1 Tax=Glomus cerebriforme TaxID=658196 RepID=A0A397TLY5_9GLOM|nr:hypothetical protein C1645_814063 [Glomus cerebriforme]